MMKIGDYVQWRDQTDYPGLCGIVTKASHPAGHAYRASREIFVHWTNDPQDFAVNSWEKEKDLELLSTGETE